MRKHKQKAPSLGCERAFVCKSGERGIRTPGPLTVNGFQDRRIRPLCHLSEGKSNNCCDYFNTTPKIIAAG